MRFDDFLGDLFCDEDGNIYYYLKEDDQKKKLNKRLLTYSYVLFVFNNVEYLHIEKPIKEINIGDIKDFISANEEYCIGSVYNNTYIFSKKPVEILGVEEGGNHILKKDDLIYVDLDFLSYIIED